MATLTEMAEKVQFIVDNFDYIAGAALEELEEQALDVNRAQLMDGMGSDGLPTHDYNPSFMLDGQPYVNIKNRMNAGSGGRYDMNFSGASFRSMRLEVDGSGYKITGDGWAAAYHRGYVFDGVMRGRVYGIFESIHVQNFRKQYLFPLLIQKIKNYTGAE